MNINTTEVDPHCSHVYSQHEVVNDCMQKYSSIQIRFMFQLMVHLFDNYALFTNAMFGQLLSSCSRYAANLNMKAVSFFLLIHIFFTRARTSSFTMALRWPKWLQDKLHETL